MAEEAAELAPATQDDDRITCLIDNARVHVIASHLKTNHPEWTVERYQETYPGAPLLSPKAIKVAKQRSDAKAKETLKQAENGNKFEMRPMHQVFDLGDVPAAKNKLGNPIMISVMIDVEDEDKLLVPDIDPNYVFNIDLIRVALMGLEMNIPTYFWGYHGTGKTSVFEQVCARTGRPFSRVQHTINTEEAHIVGQYIVKDGSTAFQLGPLAVAMLRGQIYCADEYDFAMPSVLAVYQPVLEGKPLVIKDAPPEFRVIRPHANFRFIATGNTNGGGDETGLYQGTQIQNAANFSRFGLVEEVPYMDEKTESTIVVAQAGIKKEDALKMTSLAKEIREAFAAGRLGSTISTRELITSAKIARRIGSDYRWALKRGYTNRLSRVDQKVVDEFAQRVFG